MSNGADEMLQKSWDEMKARISELEAQNERLEREARSAGKDLAIQELKRQISESAERVSEVTRDRDLEKRMRKDADEYRERVLEENTRLREALERIAKADDHGKSCLSDSTKAQIMDWAREALQSRQGAGELGSRPELRRKSEVEGSEPAPTVQAQQVSGTPEIAPGGNGPDQVIPGSGSNPREVRQDQLGSSPSPGAKSTVLDSALIKNLTSRCDDLRQSLLATWEDMPEGPARERARGYLDRDARMYEETISKATAQDTDK